MSVICYISPERSDHDSIVNAIRPVRSDDQVQSFENIEAFLESLPVSLGMPEPPMLLAPSPGDLRRLVACRSRFEGYRIVLMLPDEAEESVTLGHLLRPRLVGVCELFISELPAVISRMLKVSTKSH
jgi:hypothetical protein